MTAQPADLAEPDAVQHSLLATRLLECNPHIVSNPQRTWYVYLLECADGTLYTGITLDPQRRLKEHNAGRGARYTRTRVPVRLLGSLPVESRREALLLERRIKRYKPSRKRAFFAQ